MFNSHHMILGFGVSHWIWLNCWKKNVKYTFLLLVVLFTCLTYVIYKPFCNNSKPNFFFHIGKIFFCVCVVYGTQNTQIQMANHLCRFESSCAHVCELMLECIEVCVCVCVNCKKTCQEELCDWHREDNQVSIRFSLTSLWFSELSRGYVYSEINGYISMQKNILQGILNSCLFFFSLNSQNPQLI